MEKLHGDSVVHIKLHNKEWETGYNERCAVVVAVIVVVVVMVMVVVNLAAICLLNAVGLLCPEKQLNNAAPLITDTGK